VSIAERIKECREDRGLSQSDLARRMVTDPSHVAHYESGRRKPTFENLCLLATSLGVSLDYLAGRSSDYDKGYRDGYFQCREDMKAATRKSLVSK